MTMTTELTKAAQQAHTPEHIAGVDHAHELLRRMGYHRDGEWFIHANRRGAEAIHVSTISTIVSAGQLVITQRPAAQEVDGVPEHLIPRIIKGVIESAAQRRATQPAHQQATPDHVPDAGNMVQATPEPAEQWETSPPDGETWETSPMDGEQWETTPMAKATPEPERCKSCDDTGHVHDQIGEWRGVCNCGLTECKGKPMCPYCAKQATPEPCKSFAQLYERNRAGVDAELAAMPAATPEPVGEPGRAFYEAHCFAFDVRTDWGSLPTAVQQRYALAAGKLYTRPAAAPAPAAPMLARSLSEWHEEDGTVMWWAWNGETRGWAGEAAYIGSPLCDDWPGYHTHWTPHPPQPMLAAAQAKGADHG